MGVLIRRYWFFCSSRREIESPDLCRGVIDRHSIVRVSQEMGVGDHRNSRTKVADEDGEQVRDDACYTCSTQRMPTLPLSFAGETW